MLRPKLTWILAGVVALVLICGQASAGWLTYPGYKKGTRPRLTRSDRPLASHEIHYKVLGQGNPETVVLVHGKDSAGATFTPILEALARKFRVVIYDQRGHGQTVDRGLNFSSPVLAGDLKSLLDHLNIKRAHLLGHSLGARTVMRFAQLYPGQVKSVVLEDMEMIPRVCGNLKKARRQAQRLRSQIRPHYPDHTSAVEALRPLFGDQAESITQRRAMENADGSVSLLFRPHISNLYRVQALAEDFTSALRGLKAPLLVVQADPAGGHSLISNKGLSHIREHQPGVQVVQIPGATHNVHGSQTDTFLSALVPFLRR